ncbi:MAG: hypothetical protein ACM3QS_12390 [Bacteroidota bacterium]
MDQTSSFGYWVRRQRKALDLTQQALALATSDGATVRRWLGLADEQAQAAAHSLGNERALKQTFGGAGYREIDVRPPDAPRPHVLRG